MTAKGEGYSMGLIIYLNLTRPVLDIQIVTEECHFLYSCFVLFLAAVPYFVPLT